MVFKVYQGSQYGTCASFSPSLYSLNAESKKLYREIYSQNPEKLEWQEKGLLMACTTSKGFEEEIEIAKIAGDLGIVTKILDAED
jgi:hypothetical protein